MLHLRCNLGLKIKGFLAPFLYIKYVKAVFYGAFSYNTHVKIQYTFILLLLLANCSNNESPVDAGLRDHVSF